MSDYKILNLADQESPGIKYKISKFPDGQQSIQILESNPESFLRISYSSIGKSEIEIRSRLNNFQDLELIICATAALRELGVRKIHLFVPYFIGARSDRKFGIGGLNYVKSVITPIINSLGFESVTVIDPHSDVLEACINSFKKITNLAIVNFSLPLIMGNKEEYQKTVLVSPDAGALKKVYDAAHEFKIPNVLIASKHRDVKTGSITHTEVPGLDNYSPDSTFVILDDICDGGRTFIELANVIRSHVWPFDEYFKGKIYLVVSHGIFSSGFEKLSDVIDGIYCTNSVKDINKETVRVQALNGNEDFVTQLNVF